MLIYGSLYLSLAAIPEHLGRGTQKHGNYQYFTYNDGTELPFNSILWIWKQQTQHAAVRHQDRRVRSLDQKASEHDKFAQWSPVELAFGVSRNATDKYAYLQLLLLV